MPKKGTKSNNAAIIDNGIAYGTLKTSKHIKVIIKVIPMIIVYALIYPIIDFPTSFLLF